jgi:hypothetical protein
MNLIITLPPKAEQEALINCWIDVLLGKSDIKTYHKLVKRYVEAGFSIHGITCILNHSMVAEMAIKRILKEESLELEVALSKPLCMN